MGLEGCGKFMKYSMFLFNSLILVAGCGLVGFGIYTRTNSTGITVQFSSILGNNLLPTISLILIVTGSVIIVLSFLGCCGAIKEVKCMLVMYFVLMLVMFLGFLVGGILIYTFRQKIEDLTLSQLRVSLNTQYGTTGQEQVTEGWDSTQKLFRCCGVQGDINSTGSWAFYKLNTDWFRNQTGNIMFVPKSCCKDTENTPNVTKCQGSAKKYNNIMPFRGPPVRPHEVNDQVYTEGCFTAFNNMLTDNSKVLGGIAVGIAVIMVIGMVFAICLCRLIRDDYYECDDDD